MSHGDPDPRVMSLIHDALKKAGGAGRPPAPPLPSSPHQGLPPSRRIEPRRLFFLVVVGILGAGIGMVAILLGLYMLLLRQDPGQGPFPKIGRSAPPAPPSAEAPLHLPKPALEMTEAPVAAPPKAAPSAPPSKPLAPPFVLSGIVQGPGENFAIINSQITRLGEEIDGAILVGIQKESVLLEEAGGRHHRLKLK